MSKKITTIITLITMASLILYVGGCTLIGLGIGAMADAGAKKTYTGWQVAKIKTGKEITVYLKDGTMLFGKYSGIAQLPENIYSHEYSQVREYETTYNNLPSLNKPISLTLKDGSVANGAFNGFDCRFDSSSIIPCISIKETGRPIPRTAAFKNIAAIQDSNGDSIDIMAISEMLDRGKIPLMTAVGLQIGVDKRDIPIDKILQITVKGSNNGKIAGALVGLGIDVTLIVIALNSDDAFDIGGGNGGGTFSSGGQMSCPFVYSFDGEKYILDSETFGGAIFKAAQRTDLDNLDHLKAFNGKYKLRITNELEETQYIDELKLEVVDHPINTTVVPSFDGKLHTFSNPIPPTKAFDFNGNNIIRFVYKKDSDFWVSNPFGRNPDNISEVRDGITLDFPRPAKSDFVKLAFNLQNTNWGAYMQGEMLKLQGSELDKWYDLMNNSVEARQKLQAIMVREGMLVIQIWNGQTWQYADFVWEVGPSVPKDQAVMIDIREIPGDALKIRLESTAGFWMINSVLADYTPDVPINITELSPALANDSYGKNQLESLTQNDGDYYDMPSRRDWADLEFSAPPLRDGYDRSIVLKSTGYYTIHVLATGEPQKELISHLMKDPGAYGQFTLRKLNDNYNLIMPSANAEMSDDK